MLDKDGTETELEAMKAYRAAREESEDADEADTDKVSSALIDKVNFFSLMQLNPGLPWGIQES